MKTIVTSMRLLVFVLAAVFFGSCTGQHKEGGVVEKDVAEDENLEKHESENDITATEAGKPQFTVTDVFQKQLAVVFNEYVELKEALVSSDAPAAQKAAGEVKDAVAKVDMSLVTGAAHNDWMNYMKGMQEPSDKISNTADIEEQRKAFSDLSDALYKSIKAFGLGGTATAYYEFCPMAFNDEGGYWLSNSDKIRNPYFGDQMLTCGSVQEKLQ